MTYFRVLVEGHADVPIVHEILCRRFRLIEKANFQIYPHQGKGRLPTYPNNPPEPQRRGLLDVLPAQLRAWASLPTDHVVVVLVDADQDDCIELKARLLRMYAELQRKPSNVLFRVAVEESESWLIADLPAVRAAYPKAKTQKLAAIVPDSVIGASERLAEALGRKRDFNRADKREWAKAIMPYVDLNVPRSPSLNAFIEGVSRFMAAPAPLEAVH